MRRFITVHRPDLEGSVEPRDGDRLVIRADLEIEDVLAEPLLDARDRRALVERFQQRPAVGDRVVEPHRFRREQQRDVDLVRRHEACGLGEACRVGPRRSEFGLVPGDHRLVARPFGRSGRSVGPTSSLDREDRGDQRGNDEHRHHGQRRDRQTPRPAVLADVLADEVLLRDPPQRGGQIGDGGGEVRVPRRKDHRLVDPPQVEVARFARERPPKARWDGRCVFGERTRVVVPRPLARRDHRQDPRRVTMCEPPVDLSTDPSGVRCGRRGHEHEPIRVGQRGLDGRPQLR